MADYNQYVAISAVQDSRDTSSLTPDQLAKYEHVIDWIDNKNPDSVGQYSQVSAEGAYGVLKPLVDNEQYVRTAYKGSFYGHDGSENVFTGSNEGRNFHKNYYG